MTYKATIIFNDTANSSVASSTQTIENVFDFRFGESVLILDTRASATDTAVLTAYPWTTIVQSNIDSVPETAEAATDEEEEQTQATPVEATPAGADTENASDSSSETPEA